MRLCIFPRIFFTLLAASSSVLSPSSESSNEGLVSLAPVFGLPTAGHLFQSNLGAKHRLPHGHVLLEGNRSVGLPYQSALADSRSSKHALTKTDDSWSEINEQFYAWATQLFPKAPRPIPPYNISRPMICRFRVNCNYTRLGIGRQGGMLQWAFAIAAPLGTTFVIIYGTSLKQRSCGKLQVDTNRGFQAMLFSALLAFATGYFCYNVADKTFSALFLIPVAVLLLSFLIVATFVLVDVEFDRPRFVSSAYLELFAFVIVMCMCAIYAGATYLELAQTKFTDASKLPAHATAGLGVFINESFAIAYCLASAIRPTNAATILWLCFQNKAYLYSYYFWEDTTGESNSLNSPWCLPVYFVTAIFSVLCFVTPYSRDRCFVATFGYLLRTSIKMGIVSNEELAWATSNFYRLPRVYIIVVMSFLCCIAMRYQIALPGPLHKVTFLRLGYLYEMRREGQKITRRQELPESAFGNPAKVVHIVIISHHWIDSHTCDSPTPEYPQGIRLTTMCQRFEQFFPTTFPGLVTFMKQPISTLVATLRTVMYSSEDVLIFFDFASLPQNGLAPDGTLIERTAEELAVFKETLPAAGLLYTMFPVMVCPEVTEAVTPYMSSGWCFCEWEQAQLCGTLSPYSQDPEHHGQLDSLVSSADAANRVDMLGVIEKELQTKLLRCETDRVIIQGIVQGTWVRRNLLTAVIDQNVGQVEELLAQLTKYNLKDTISFPVDSATLDTLLHVAMKMPSTDIICLLIDYGADQTCPNHRGEIPGNFLIFSRSWIPCL